MKKSAFISDIIFTFFAVWIATLCLLRHLKWSLPLSIIIAALCGALAACAHAALSQSKRKTLLLKRSDSALKEKLNLHLALLGDEEKATVFADALTAENPERPVSRVGKSRLQDDERTYFLLFRFAPVTSDDVARIARTKSKLSKTLICSQIEENAAELCVRLQIDVRAGDYAFRLFKATNTLPEKYLCDTPTKDKRFRRLRLCFAKTNSARFLLSATLVLLLSLITPFPFYYLVFGGILLLAALFIRIFGYR